MTAELPVKMTEKELYVFLAREFPQLANRGEEYDIESVGGGEARVRLKANDLLLRPGGTIAGPAMMTLADMSSYVVILAHVGPVALAVTTNLNMNFLRKPAPGDLVCTCKFLKLGKRLVVTDSAIISADSGDLVAHATATYSIPPS